MIANNYIKHCAVYLRLSRDEENRGIEEMLAAHRHTLTQLCKNNKWSYETFEEIASSKTIQKRDKMVELLELIQQDRFDAVVVMDIDRLSRNEYDASDIKRILFLSGTYIVTPTKIYDPSKDEDSLLLGIQSLVASQEYKQILKRMQRGKRYASTLGHWVNGVPPLGYEKDFKTKKLVPTADAEHIKFIFNSIVNGKTVSDVCHDLNSMGVKTRTGSKFHFNAILRLLNNENYKGTIVSNREIGKHDGERPREEWIYIENAHPAIIGNDTWNKANQIVNTYKFSRKRSDVKTYPTSKLLYCANCDKIQGVQMTKLNKLYLKICPVCKNRAFAYEPILQSIKSEVATYRQNVLASIGAIENDNGSSDTEYKIKQLETQLRKATMALDRIELLFEEMEIDLKQYRERKTKRNEEILLLNTELEKLKAETPKDKIADLSEILKQVDYLLGNWKCLDGKGLTDEEVNRALHFIVERITWKYDFSGAEPELKITWK